MEDNIHKLSSEFEEQDEFFQHLKVPYKRDKQAVWEELNQTIEGKAKTKIIPLLLTKVGAAAAVIAILTVGFMRFYITTVESKRGEHLAHTLPDNSVVHLNAASSIRYAPYWWSWQRSVTLKGEAFFEVEKGSSFIVSSELGYTEVLGTSFNIYARNTDYRVFCKTGKVGVSTADLEQSIVLVPNERGVLRQDVLLKEKEENAETSTAWLNNKFHFNNMPLNQVLEELERQYDLKIEYDKGAFTMLEYVGFFDKGEKIDSTLKIVGETMGFTYIKENDQLYKLLPNT